MDYISFHSVLGHYLMLTSDAVSSVFTHQLSRTSRSNSSLTSTYAKTDDRSGHPSRTTLAQLWENFAHLIAILSYVSHPRPQNSTSQDLLCPTLSPANARPLLVQVNVSATETSTFVFAEGIKSRPVYVHIFERESWCKHQEVTRRLHTLELSQYHGIFVLHSTSHITQVCINSAINASYIMLQRPIRLRRGNNRSPLWELYQTYWNLCATC